MLALDDALVRVNQQLHLAPPAAASSCAQLAEASATLLNLPAPPVPDLAEPALAGLESFERAAAACQAGDYTAANQQLSEGAALRADASLELDMLLMGHTHH